ncbi:MAG TPA: hypothetical protein PK228_22005 [Saprospiraceae bacterium]|nr:hypothetical protein [Saprospiraceae bacterium]
MEAGLQTPFNSAQVEILKLFSQGLTDEQMEELRRTLIAFRFKLLDDHVEQVAERKGLTTEQINQASWEHRRTPYQSKQKAGK